jgi:hypothetical protein
MGVGVGGAEGEAVPTVGAALVAAGIASVGVAEDAAGVAPGNTDDEHAVRSTGMIAVNVNRTRISLDRG